MSSIAIFAKYSKLPHEDVSNAYDFLLKHDFFSPTGQVSKSKFDSLANILKQLGDIKGATDVSRFVMPGVTLLAD